MNTVTTPAPEQSHFAPYGEIDADVESEEWYENGAVTPHGNSVDKEGANYHTETARRMFKNMDSVPVGGKYDAITKSPGRGLSYSVENVSQAVGAWHSYLSEREHDTVVINDAEIGDMMVLPHTHRWSESYMKKTYAKVSKVQQACEALFSGSTGDTIPTTMFTLTASHTDDTGRLRPPMEVLEQLKEGWGKLRQTLWKRLRGKSWEYVRMIEHHKSGYAHIHVAVIGVASKSLQEKVESLWTEKYGIGSESHGVSTEVNGKGDRDIQNLGGYLFKYISKNLNMSQGQVDVGETPVTHLPEQRGYHINQAVMWLSNTQAWSMSANLRNKVSELMAGGENQRYKVEYRQNGVEKNEVIFAESEVQAKAQFALNAPDSVCEADIIDISVLEIDRDWEVLGGAKYLRPGFYPANPSVPSSSLKAGTSSSSSAVVDALNKLFTWKENGRDGRRPDHPDKKPDKRVDMRCVLSERARKYNRQVDSVFGADKITASDVV